MKSVSSRRPYRIGRSKTGLGLFATRLIRRRKFILHYTGRRLPNSIADYIDNKYMFELSKHWTMDGSSRRNVARYINHSCKPNAESDVVRGKIVISAMKNIHPGDEITYSYGANYFKSFIKPKGCRCAACSSKTAVIRSPRRVAKRRKATKRRRRTKSRR